MPLEQLLAPFLQSPKRLESRPDGGVQECYTLRLQSGQGTSLELPALGELGLYADSGMLRLLVPWVLAPVVVRAVATLEPLGPYQVPSSRTGAPLADFWFHVHAGQRLALPILAFGEVLIEVG
jgi:hypothetical protein